MVANELRNEINDVTIDTNNRNENNGGNERRRERRFPLNSVYVDGVIIKEPEYSHQSWGINFYEISLDVKRISGIVDSVPIVVPENLIDKNINYVGKTAHIRGNYRSRNEQAEGEERRHLVLYVYARDFSISEEQVGPQSNRIMLTGTIVRPPVLRKTPSGLSIADVFIAVRRTRAARRFVISDYIPCIFWNTQAESAADYKVGDRIQIIGRIQSRNYNKVLEDGATETRTAYEVSGYSLRAAASEPRNERPRNVNRREEVPKM